MTHRLFHFPSRWRARLVTACLVLSLTACAAIQTVETPNSVSGTALNSSENTMRTYEVAITREAIIPGSLNDVFDFITAQDVLPKVLTGYGPLPAVVRTSEVSGPWDTPGSSRIVHLADGSTVREQITEFSRSKSFAYRVYEFGNPIIGTLATSARGVWTFSDASGGVRVSWIYTFVAKNSLTAIPLSGITQILWRGYMNVCLENSIRLMRSSRTRTRQAGQSYPG